MAPLPKAALLGKVEEAVRDSGWNLLHVGSAGRHPADYQVYREDRSHRARVYIWNLSHGGGAKRPAHEYRIQITGIAGPDGIARFAPQIGGKTLILGWWDQGDVFVGFDYLHHGAALGTSPSIQVGKAALVAAQASGFAPYNKGNGELAIAFRPEFLGTYIDALESLHGCGTSAVEIGILDELAADPVAVADVQIAEHVAEIRRFAVVSTKRALRDLDFRGRVLSAYGHRCAMCGMQLRLLDAAHILPVADPASTDATSNGVALCALHHRAYDRSFIAFDERFCVMHNLRMTEKVKAAGHDGRLLSFMDGLRPSLLLPTDTEDRPAPTLIKAANALRGW